MKRRIAVILAVTSCFGVLGAGTASASSEYFYYNNWLGPNGAVSGAPHPSLYFVAAYSTTSEYYCVRVQSVGGTEKCTTGSGVSSSFVDGGFWWRGELWNKSPTARFIAEERW